ncbi:MAG TPA: WYL domain-containing protein [Rikenellaceae bacterium]|nr:WYL domain-containing protein [Rikenellaceae bacterium]
MAKNYFKSYIWLLETLQSRGPLTLAQLRELWEHSAVNEDGRDLAPRTFANHVAAIADIFGIDITCDRRNNTYYIENDDDLDGNGLRSWMLDALSMNSLLNESASIKDRIIFEDVPSSHQFLASIIQAIRDNRMIRVHYKGYRMEEDRFFDIEPYFIREFKRRWYLYGHKDYDKDRKPHMYALDRMLSVEVLSDTFKMPEEINAREWFKTIYGVRKYDDMKPQKVLIKAYGKQARYFRSLPLHSSQEEVETRREYSVFSYELAPDYDFVQDVLGFGDMVEVLAPKALREKVKTITCKMVKNYGNE